MLLGQRIGYKIGFRPHFGYKVELRPNSPIKWDSDPPIFINPVRRGMRCSLAGSFKTKGTPQRTPENAPKQNGITIKRNLEG